MAEEDEGREKEMKQQQQDKSWMKEAIFFYIELLL